MYLIFTQGYDTDEGNIDEGNGGIVAFPHISTPHFSLRLFTEETMVKAVLTLEEAQVLADTINAGILEMTKGE